MTSDTGKTLRRAADPAQVYLNEVAPNQVRCGLPGAAILWISPRAMV
ncbi:MAG: hypothetical protein IIB66_01570 [Proteobacteria bacterium]|nr:hypothetical protein [Pseudomonadota bacterium]